MTATSTGSQRRARHRDLAARVRAARDHVDAALAGRLDLIAQWPSEARPEVPVCRLLSPQLESVPVGSAQALPDAVGSANLADRIAFLATSAALLQAMHDQALSFGGELGCLLWSADSAARIRVADLCAVCSADGGRLDPCAPCLRRGAGAGPGARADRPHRGVPPSSADRAALSHLAETLLGPIPQNAAARSLMRRARRSPLSAPQAREWVRVLVHPTAPTREASFRLPSTVVDPTGPDGCALHVVVLDGPPTAQWWAGVTHQLERRGGHDRVMVVAGRNAERLERACQSVNRPLPCPQGRGQPRLVSGPLMEQTLAEHVIQALIALDADGVSATSVIVHAPEPQRVPGLGEVLAGLVGTT